ncbi:uncharacterized protein LOC143287421 [Babylonia areolata]|uniref:uncharacterized protein LOC143287421 n=1 Tax=Babylonia areolata TaxID=304850 RepID=UPI003FD5FA0E
MADLNQSLKDYLSRSQKSNTNGQSEGKSYFSGWFQKDGDDADDKTVNEVANGWFSDAQKDPLLPSLTKKQRILGFVMCLLMGTFCFSLASLYLPMLLLKARKFALLYTLGSLFVISSFSFLWGPYNHVKHLFSMTRLPFTSVYFGTMFATIYFSMWVHSTVFTVICALGQIVALVWYIISYIPGGQTGLKFFSNIFYAVASKTVSKTLPV